MSVVESLARLDAQLRPFMMHAPASWTTAFYSRTRPRFIKAFAAERPKAYIPQPKWSQELWGLTFRSPIFNAAGMFKNGEGYEVVAAQGAGAYLSGTTTARARMGNTKRGITHPFVPYPGSGSASNWMGLPNRGHAVVANVLSRVNKVPGCPMGASLSSDPEQQGLEALGSLVEGMSQYEQAGVDFMELNESCPNVVAPGHQARMDELDPSLIERLEYVAQNFLKKRTRPLPLIVKLSNDTNPDLIPALVDLLCTLGFDGINLGNTSIQYERHAPSFVESERGVFRYFRENFGGGLSGRVLHDSSLELSRAAAQHAARSMKNSQFHVIRCGGIESLEDVQQSQAAGIALCEWYTGYFERFAQNGHQLYQRFLGD